MGLGLRQGEGFGLAPDDIRWLRGTVHVRRQVTRTHVCFLDYRFVRQGGRLRDHAAAARGRSAALVTLSSVDKSGVR